MRTIPSTQNRRHVYPAIVITAVAALGTTAYLRARNGLSRPVALALTSIEQTQSPAWLIVDVRKRPRAAAAYPSAAPPSARRPYRPRHRRNRSTNHRRE
jgi:hypothetical protein